ncbi:hypothetical protein KIPB_013424, partial [Kipferlia bialata]
YQAAKERIIRRSREKDSRGLSNVSLDAAAVGVGQPMTNPIRTLREKERERERAREAERRNVHRGAYRYVAPRRISEGAFLVASGESDNPLSARGMGGRRGSGSLFSQHQAEFSNETPATRSFLLASDGVGVDGQYTGELTPSASLPMLSLMDRGHYPSVAGLSRSASLAELEDMQGRERERERLRESDKHRMLGVESAGSAPSSMSLSMSKVVIGGMANDDSPSVSRSTSPSDLAGERETETEGEAEGSDIAPVPIKSASNPSLSSQASHVSGATTHSLSQSLSWREREQTKEGMAPFVVDVQMAPQARTGG